MTKDREFSDVNAPYLFFTEITNDVFDILVLMASWKIVSRKMWEEFYAVNEIW